MWVVFVQHNGRFDGEMNEEVKKLRALVSCKSGGIRSFSAGIHMHGLISIFILLSIDK